MRFLLRVAIGALLALIVVIAMVPLLVLRNLNSGGTGWGLCADGLGACSNSYFAGFELVAGLLFALLVVVVLLRVATRSLRWTEHRYDRQRAALATIPNAPPTVVASRDENQMVL